MTEIVPIFALHQMFTYVHFIRYEVHTGKLQLSTGVLELASPHTPAISTLSSLLVTSIFTIVKNVEFNWTFVTKKVRFLDKIDGGCVIIFFLP